MGPCAAMGECYFGCFVLLRRRLSMVCVAAQCRGQVPSYLGSWCLVRLIFAALERKFSLSLNPSIAGV